MKKKELNFTVNGRAEAIDVTPRARLLDALRIDLGLTGTKEGCGTGDCGSCTVLLDGNAVNSCMVLALQAEGREITTIEGLGKPGALDPVQQAMVQCGGIQCGFCTPGMALSLKDLFSRVPEPDEEEVRVAISSSLVLPVSPRINANPNSMIPELMALSTRNFSDASVERLSLAMAISATVASALSSRDT